MRALLALPVVLALAACGGSDDQGAQDTSASASTTGTGAEAAEQVLRIAWSAEPPSLDPGLATDTTSGNVVLNIMDPLVRLDDDLEPQPSLAESWAQKGNVVTFKLRHDGRWTNGDPVTAHDFEYSWKRTLSPELAADYAYQLYGIKGATEYNSCEKNCDALADKVAVKAVDDYTLQVELTSPQPWFIQQVSHHSFLAVHKATVEKYGDKWTDPKNIVTDGAFKLESWDHDSSIVLVKNEDWRGAADVKLTRVEGRIITDGTTLVQAFEAGEVDTLDGNGLPPAEIPRLKDTPEYQKYPSLGTSYIGINVKNIPDVNQRRAMAFAINRQEIIDNITQADETPASSFTPEGISGYDVIKQDYIPTGDAMDEAKALMEKVASPVTKVNYLHPNGPGQREIAVAIQSYWKQIGIDTEIKSQEWAQFLEFIGPPPDKSVDAYALGWVGDFPDAINFLELWTCDSGNNNTNFCNPEYDKLIAKAKTTADEADRFELYRQAEAILTSAEGELPVLPTNYYVYTNLENESVKDSFNINLLDQFNFADVVIKD